MVESDDTSNTIGVCFDFEFTSRPRALHAITIGFRMAQGRRVHGASGLDVGRGTVRGWALRVRHGAYTSTTGMVRGSAISQLFQQRKSTNASHAAASTMYFGSHRRMLRTYALRMQRPPGLVDARPVNL